MGGILFFGNLDLNTLAIVFAKSLIFTDSIFKMKISPSFAIFVTLRIKEAASVIDITNLVILESVTVKDFPLCN